MTTTPKESKLLPKLMPPDFFGSTDFLEQQDSINEHFHRPSKINASNVFTSRNPAALRTLDDTICVGPPDIRRGNRRNVLKRNAEALQQLGRRERRVPALPKEPSQAIANGKTLYSIEDLKEFYDSDPKSSYKKMLNTLR